MFSQQAKVCTVVPGDLFHILTKGRRYFVFEILHLFISIVQCLLWSNILIAVRIYTDLPSVQIYCHEANLPALLSNYQQAIVPLLSNYQQGTAPLLSNYQQATVPLLSNYIYI